MVAIIIVYVNDVLNFISDVDDFNEKKEKQAATKKVGKNIPMSDTESCSSLYHMTGSTTNCEASHHSTLAR